MLQKLLVAKLYKKQVWKVFDKCDTVIGGNAHIGFSPLSIWKLEN